MTSKNVPYLCGGTLFSLILQARRNRSKARDKLSGGSDGLKDTDLMMGLVKVVTGEEPYSQGGTFGKCTTQFKTCQDYGSTYIPFKDPTVISTFTSAVNKKDPDLLERMSEFINKFLNENLTEWLVKALIEVIQGDEGIASDTEFAISSAVAVTKNSMDSVISVELPYFMLSVLSFILTNRPDNTKGRTTFEVWHSQSTPKSAWRYSGNVGDSIKRSISVKSNYSVTDNSKADASDIADTATNGNPQSAHGKLADKILASGQAVADAWGNAIENLADDKTDKKQGKPKLCIDSLSDSDLQYLQRFRKQAKPILTYCIDNDPSGGPTKLSLADEIDALWNDWKYDIDEVSDNALRQLIEDTVQVLDDYSEYLSERYLRVIPDKGVLLFKNESLEEGKILKDVLRPNTIRLRYEMRDLYLRLYPTAAERQKRAEGQTVIKQQTNVVQNGTNNVNLTNNGTLNLNL